MQYKTEIYRIIEYQELSEYTITFSKKLFA
jgi:hypothetical protein